MTLHHLIGVCISKRFYEDHSVVLAAVQKVCRIVQNHLRDKGTAVGYELEFIVDTQENCASWGQVLANQPQGNDALAIWYEQVHNNNL